MRYTIYKVTNQNNGKIYIGKHQTDKPYDNYLGSGRGIVNAIKYHGYDAFVKEVLFDFDTEEEMNQKEKELVTEEFVNRKDTYNQGVGGNGGPHFKGNKHSEVTKLRLSELRKSFVMHDSARLKISEANRARSISDDTRRKLSLSTKRRFENEFHKNKLSDIMKQRHAQGLYKPKVYIRSEEHRNKMKNIMKQTYAKKDLMWVKNPTTLESKQIEVKDYDAYAAKGFIKGRYLKT